MREIPVSNPEPRLPKLCGADIELGNFVLGMARRDGTCHEACRAVLREIHGLPVANSHSYSCSSSSWQPAVYGGRRDERDQACTASYSQDWGRKFLPRNGGCAYIDLDHLELCIPEVTSAWDHVAAWHAMLRIAREALAAANGDQPSGRKIQVLVNNSDGQGNSYGSHLNFLISRRAWDNIFVRKLHQLQYLASFQVSSLVITGQGKVGAENGAPETAYQISQRADFFKTLIGSQTTFDRPIVNSRDETLCGRAGAVRDGASPARLHSIFFDNTLAHVPCLLKVGLMQMILAMIEGDCANPALLLDDPVDAVVRFSHDPTLEARAALASGREATAVELQLLFLEEAQRFAAGGGFDGIVPRSAEILTLWEDTLTKLKARNLAALARRLDWVIKLVGIERAMDRRPGLDWNSSEIKFLDHLYSSLDGDGLYWAYEKSGLVERVVSDEQIQALADNPPPDTRAWTRAMLLRLAPPESVNSVDWDSITFKLRGRSFWPAYRTVALADPRGFTKAETESAFRDMENLEDVLDALEVSPDEATADSWPETKNYQHYLPAN